MVSAKELIVKVVPSKVAVEFIKKNHYSGTVTNNSNLHFGVFLGNVMHGAASFGPGMDKRKTINLVAGTGWNNYLELNRLAFDSFLPRNSESRALAVMFRLIKKNAPQIKWILTYADGSQCGDGTIYRAAGFLLTGIKKNTTMVRLPDGRVVAKLVFEPAFGKVSATSLAAKYGKSGIYASWSASKFFKHIGAKTVEGFQLRYIKLLDPTCRLNCEIIPFERIAQLGAAMYLGKKIQAPVV